MRAAFLCLCFRFVLYLGKTVGAKAERRMLMKLNLVSFLRSRCSSFVNITKNSFFYIDIFYNCQALQQKTGIIIMHLQRKKFCKIGSWYFFLMHTLRISRSSHTRWETSGFSPRSLSVSFCTHSHLGPILLEKFVHKSWTVSQLKMKVWMH